MDEHARRLARRPERRVHEVIWHRQADKRIVGMPQMVLGPHVDVSSMHPCSGRRVEIRSTGDYVAVRRKLYDSGDRMDFSFTDYAWADITHPTRQQGD
jgi:hypothetical protein